MREVLFRGKRTEHNRWIEGYLYRLSEKLNPFIMLKDKGGTAFEVIPETVSEFTGLTDKNGKKIFEGDIIVIDHTTRTHGWEYIPETYKPRRSHSVVYDDIKNHLTYKRNYAVEWKEKRARWILRNGSDQHELTDAYLFFHNGIIIGNIHDNPKLLEGGEQE